MFPHSFSVVFLFLKGPWSPAGPELRRLGSGRSDALDIRHLAKTWTARTQRELAAVLDQAVCRRAFETSYEGF